MIPLTHREAGALGLRTGGSLLCTAPCVPTARVGHPDRDRRVRAPAVGSIVLDSWVQTDSLGQLNESRTNLDPSTSRRDAPRWGGQGRSWEAGLGIGAGRDGGSPAAEGSFLHVRLHGPPPLATFHRSLAPNATLFDVSTRWGVQDGCKRIVADPIICGRPAGRRW
jgi:hypothetical protein